MEKVIEANLARAKRGGIPGTLSLIEAYLNVKQNSQFLYEVLILSGNLNLLSNLYILIRTVFMRQQIIQNG